MAAAPHPNVIDSSERFGPAIDAIKKREAMPKSDWEKLEAVERQSAFTVANVTRASVLQDVLDSLERAVRDGTDLEQFKDDVGLKLIEEWGGVKPGRLETIFRTNLATSYSEGHHAAYSQPAVKKARPFLRFDATMDDRVTDECAALDGTVLPADDPFWKTHTPPLHFNCRSVLVSLDEDEAEEEGVSSEAPDVDAADGFGDAPGREVKDWDWDLSRFDPELRDVLEGLTGDE